MKIHFPDCDAISLTCMSCSLFGGSLLDGSSPHDLNLVVGRKELEIVDGSKSCRLLLPWDSILNYDVSRPYFANKADALSPLLTLLVEVEIEGIQIQPADNPRLPKTGVLVVALTSSVSSFARTSIWHDLEKHICKSSGIGIPQWARTVIDLQCPWLLIPCVYKILREKKIEKTITAILCIIGLASAFLSLCSSLRNLYLAVPESREAIENIVQIITDVFGMYISIMLNLSLKLAYLAEMFFLPFSKALLTIIQPAIQFALLLQNTIQPVGIFVWSVWGALVKVAKSLSMAFSHVKSVLVYVVSLFAPVSRALLTFYRAMNVLLFSCGKVFAACFGASTRRLAGSLQKLLLNINLLLQPLLQALKRLISAKFLGRLQFLLGSCRNAFGFTLSVLKSSKHVIFKFHKHIFSLFTRFTLRVHVSKGAHALIRIVCCTYRAGTALAARALHICAAAGSLMKDCCTLSKSAYGAKLGLQGDPSAI